MTGWMVDGTGGSIVDFYQVERRTAAPGAVKHAEDQWTPAQAAEAHQIRVQKLSKRFTFVS